ncbi:MAG: hypothetical protein LBG71_03280 [Clostridiales Family XIII bacterium]|jgi:hypothetical protein|nr:hypothetical protein [Clostridiales Family XIII bacterium]
MRNIAKTVAWGLLVCLALTGCVDFYSDKRPNAYQNTRWVAESPSIYFDVNEKYRQVTGGYTTYGKIEIDGVTTKITVSFDYGAGIEFYDISPYMPTGKEENYVGYGRHENYLFRGDCKFGRDKFVVRIRNNERGFLDDSIEEIVFVREDMPETEKGPASGETSREGNEN